MARPPKPSAPPAARHDEPRQGFLARWSRRKRNAREEEQAAARQEPLKAPEAPKTDADMPALETLNEHSDYSGFLSPGVSERLRQAALRKLFHLPQLNVVDGLDDYAEDYRVFAPLGDIVTADMRHRREMEEQRARERQRELEANQETSVAQEKPAEEQTPEPGAAAHSESAPPPADKAGSSQES